MYEERDFKTRRILSVVIKVLFVILALLIVWVLIPKDNNQISKKDFNSYLNAMENSAREFFVDDNLPEEIDKSVKLTLKEMLDKDLIVEPSGTCNLKNSFIKATKEKENVYELNVHLECGKKSDSIKDVIKFETEKKTEDKKKDTDKKDEEVSTTTPSDESQSNIEENDTSVASDNNSNNKSSSGSNSKGNNKSNSNSSSVATTQYATEYQHRKIVQDIQVIYSCPSGFTLEGAMCYKKLVATYDIIHGGCTDGFIQNGDICYKEAIESIPATTQKHIYQSYVYEWSRNSYLPGYDATGVTRKVAI